MELTNENYFSKDASMEYMGYSQFKSFMDCEACGLAKAKREYEQKSTAALMFGSYIDAYYSNEMKDFTKNHPEIFNKLGVLKAEYQKAEEIINFLKSDPIMSKYLENGEHQKIMTGEIAGVKFKIKMDVVHPGKCIVDQKVMRDLNPVWVEELHSKVNFVKAWGYEIEGAIYQEIYRQNTGEKLPFILAVVTKEDVPRKALLQIDQEDLDEALELVKANAPRFDAIKKGLIEPKRCETCDYCKSTSMVTGVFSYHTLDPLENYDI